MKNDVKLQREFERLARQMPADARRKLLKRLKQRAEKKLPRKKKVL